MSQSGQYLLGDSPAEVQHLVNQAEVYSEEADQLFDAVGIQPGSSAIDVGCGVMGVLHLLCARVGPRGRVVGLDREQDFNIGRRLPRMLRGAGLEDVRARGTVRVTQRGDYYQTFVLTISTLVRDLIVGSGELTANEFDSYTASLRAHLDQPGAITCQPMIWQAWARVPGQF